MTPRQRDIPTRPVLPADLTTCDPKLACEGYTIYCHIHGDPHVFLINMDGDTVHKWDTVLSPHYAEILPNGNLLFMGNMPDSSISIHEQKNIIQEITWDGEITWEYSGSDIHHDFAKLPNGNMLLLGREVIPRKISQKVKGGTTGKNDSDMLGDFFIEITPDGNTVWEWHTHEHLDFDDDVICPLCNRVEWTHANSCEPLPNGDILTTFRQTHTVAIIDRKTGEFRWKWGKDELGHPHDPTLLPNGNVLIFDNGMHIRRLPRSRVVEVNPDNNEIVWSYESVRYLDFFSPHISGAQRLWNGNTLICEGDRGRIFEVTPDREIVWEFYNPRYIQDKMLEKILGPIIHNWVFRAQRYPPDYPAFEGKGFTPA